MVRQVSCALQLSRHHEVRETRAPSTNYAHGERLCWRRRSIDDVRGVTKGGIGGAGALE